MIIRHVDVHTVRWPLRMQRSQGFGDVQASVPGVVLRLRTEDGLAGWGEAAPLPAFFGTVEGSAAALNVHLRPLIIGRSAEDLPGIMAQADRSLAGHPEAKAAIEMALIDIIGQARRVPAALLLGGVHRREIPLSVSIANPDFDEDLEFAARLIAEGIRLFKVKTGFLDHAADLKRLERLSAILPADAALSLDYNQALPAFDAIRRLRDVESFRPRYIEQPVPRMQHAAMREIATAIATPLMADESVFTPEDALQLAQERYARAIAVKLMKSGGFRKVQQVCDIAMAAGMPCFGGTMYEGGIALTAGIHLVAATANISLGAEFYSANYAFGTDILSTPIRIHDGKLQLPEGNGLGIGVDEDRLAAITVRA